MNRPALVVALTFACFGSAGNRAFSAEFLMDAAVQEGLAGIRFQAAQIRTNIGAQAGRRVQLLQAEEKIDMTQYPVLGIDISHYQEYIDWDKVKKGGVAFVYMKATEGGDFVDHLFQENWKGASRAGLTKGAYHFYNFCRDGAVQAENFIRTVPNEKGSMPPAIDMEISGSCSNMPPRDKLRKELDVFMRQIKEVYGKTPVIYLTYDIYSRYFVNDSEGIRIWIRDMNGTPQMPDGRGWIFWQYSDEGEVVGIGKPVDLDAFNGSEEEFDALVRDDVPPAVRKPLP